MSHKLPTTLLTTNFKPHYLSLRVLQSQCPPPNPTRPPLPFLIPALATPSSPLPRSLTQPSSPFPPHQHQQTAAFSTTTPWSKQKAGKKQDTNKRGGGAGGASNEGTEGGGGGMHDLSEYEAGIERAQGRLREELAKVQPGGVGRDLEALEGVRVVLGGKGEGGNVRLGDVAQVVPRGKAVVVLVGEREHVKAITSALSQPPHNLNPQPSPTEPLTLTIPLPPVTQESRQEAAKLAGQKGEAALLALREARGAHRKKLQKFLAGGKVKSDNDGLRRAEREMEKVNEKAVALAKKLVEEGKKRVMGH